MDTKKDKHTHNKTTTTATTKKKKKKKKKKQRNIKTIWKRAKANGKKRKII